MAWIKVCYWLLRRRFRQILQVPLIFQWIHFQENSSPAVHTISLPCSEILPHKSVKKEKHHDLLLSSTHVAWVGSCGRGKCFWKPGDWENLHYSGQPTVWFNWTAVDQYHFNCIGITFGALFHFLCRIKCHAQHIVLIFNNRYITVRGDLMCLNAVLAGLECTSWVSWWFIYEVFVNFL